MKLLAALLIVCAVLRGTTPASALPINLDAQTEIVPLGASAPISCSGGAVDGGTGGGVDGGTGGGVDGGTGGGEDEEVACTASDIDSQIYEQLDILVQAAVTNFLSDATITNLIEELVLEIDSTISPLTFTIDDVVNVIESNIATEIANIAAGFSFATDDVVDAIVDVLSTEDFGCTLSEEVVASVVASYVPNIGALVQSQLELIDINNILNGVLADTTLGLNNAVALSALSNAIATALDTSLSGNSGAISSSLENQILTSINTAISSAEISAAISGSASGGGRRKKRQADTVPLETSVTAAVQAAIDCVVSGTITNTVDEFIVQALSEIVAASGDSVDIASIDSIVTGAISSDAISTQLEALISQGNLEEAILAAVQANLSNANISSITELDDITAAIQSSLDTEALPALVAEVIAESTSPESITASLTTAVNNAVLEGQISTALQTSLQTPEVCGAIEAALAASLGGAINNEALTTPITDAIIVAINTVVTNPELAEAISTLNDQYLETVLEGLLSNLGLSSSKATVASEIITVSINKLTDGLHNGDEVAQALTNTIATLIEASTDKKHPLTFQSIMSAVFSLNTSSKAPSKVIKPTYKPAVKIVPVMKKTNLKKPMFKKVVPSKVAPKAVVPFAKSLQKLLKKVAKIFVKGSPVKTSSGKSKRSVDYIYKKFTEVFGEISNTFTDLGIWAADFPIIGKYVRHAQKHSFDNIRKDVVEFLAGFNFINVEALTDFDIWNYSVEDFTSIFTSFDLEDNFLSDFIVGLEDTVYDSLDEALSSFKGMEKRFKSFFKIDKLE